MTSETQTIQRLREKIFEAFRDTPELGVNEITAHRCEECDAVRDDFVGVKWLSAPDSLIEENVDALSLFTPKAYRYFLPAYLLYALKKFDAYDTVLEFVLYSLAPSERIKNISYMTKRKSAFPKEQKDVIVAFLEFVNASLEMEVNSKYTEKALQFWKKAG